MSNHVHVRRASLVAIGLASLLAATIVLIGCTKKDDASTSPTPVSSATEALSGSAGGPHHMGRMHDEDGGRHHGEHGDKDENK